MKIGSLFSGIGGLERGVEAAVPGSRVVWQAETDQHARAVLAQHYPDARRYNDVREIDAEAEKVDIICGGFPCQDISDAGIRVGITGKRSGLWREFARIVRVLRPGIVFIENVASLAIRGLDVVLEDLAACGYDAVWDCFRAADVGAPHKRERIFILAYPAGAGRGRAAIAELARRCGQALQERQAQPDGRGLDLVDAGGEGFPGAAGRVRETGVAHPDGDRLRQLSERNQRRGGRVRASQRWDAELVDDRETLADADSRRLEGERVAQPGGLEGAPGREPDGRDPLRYVHNFPPGPAAIDGWAGPEPAVRRGAHGTPVGMDGRWRAKNGRADRIRLLGNAVVPQQATLAFLTLLAAAAESA